LMGASGAGKSTLLDVLARRKTAGKIEGEIMYNNIPLTESVISALSGYVEQVESHHPHSTVKEVIQFSARLRGTKTDVDQRTQEVMKALGIENVADKVIGDPMLGGIPLELRKKASIAVELVANPEILFLDVSLFMIMANN
jgi:ATP-binding cassette subfamily G (WHITE) protein 2 (SNQ2)